MEEFLIPDLVSIVNEYLKVKAEFLVGDHIRLLLDGWHEVFSVLIPKHDHKDVPRVEIEVKGLWRVDEDGSVGLLENVVVENKSCQDCQSSSDSCEIVLRVSHTCPCHTTLFEYIRCCAAHEEAIRASVKESLFFSSQ